MDLMTHERTHNRRTSCVPSQNMKENIQIESEYEKLNKAVQTEQAVTQHQW